METNYPLFRTNIVQVISYIMRNTHEFHKDLVFAVIIVLGGFSNFFMILLNRKSISKLISSESDDGFKENSLNY